LHHHRQLITKLQSFDYNLTNHNL